MSKRIIKSFLLTILTSLLLITGCGSKKNIWHSVCKIPDQDIGEYMEIFEEKEYEYDIYDTSADNLKIVFSSPFLGDERWNSQGFQRAAIKLFAIRGVPAVEVSFFSSGGAVEDYYQIDAAGNGLAWYSVEDTDMGYTVLSGRPRYFGAKASKEDEKKIAQNAEWSRTLMKETGVDTEGLFGFYQNLCNQLGEEYSKGIAILNKISNVSDYEWDLDYRAGGETHLWFNNDAFLKRDKGGISTYVFERKQNQETKICIIYRYLDVKRYDGWVRLEYNKTFEGSEYYQFYIEHDAEEVTESYYEIVTDNGDLEDMASNENLKEEYIQFRELYDQELDKHNLDIQAAEDALDKINSDNPGIIIRNER